MKLQSFFLFLPLLFKLLSNSFLSSTYLFLLFLKFFSEFSFAFVELSQDRRLTRLLPLWVSGSLQQARFSRACLLTPKALLISALEGPLPDHSGRQGLMGLSPLW